MSTDHPVPIQRGFEYEVRLAVSIPLAWAELLKLAAKHHYDYKCRESGDRGTVNGLYNTACDGEYPSTLAVSWSISIAPPRSPSSFTTTPRTTR